VLAVDAGTGMGIHSLNGQGKLEAAMPEDLGLTWFLGLKNLITTRRSDQVLHFLPFFPRGQLVISHVCKPQICIKDRKQCVGSRYLQIDQAGIEP
jgi:hypothetical protein